MNIIPNVLSGFLGEYTAKILTFSSVSPGEGQDKECWVFCMKLNLNTKVSYQNKFIRCLTCLFAD